MPDTPDRPASFTLEREQRFSSSLIWRISKAYYGAAGPAAFDAGNVPNYITNNSFIARAYAKVAFGFLRDCVGAGAIDASEPVYIIEIGAGAGRLSYGVLQNLRQLLEWSPLKHLTLKIVLTDFSDTNRAFWRQHWRWTPLIEAGQAASARFNVEADSSLQLEQTGETLTRGGIRNPIVVLANYIFGTVPNDLFWIDESGRLHESLVTLRAAQQSIDWAKPDVLRDLEIEYTRRPASKDYYPSPAWNRLLDHCRKDLHGKVISFPTAALACVDNLAALSNNRFLLLTADKGYHHEQISFNMEPPLAVHASFSAFVNYRAMALYCEQQGGSSFATSYAAKGLDTCVFAFLPNASPIETGMAFDDAIGYFNPRDFGLLIRAIEDSKRLTLEDFLALLRFSNYDAFVLWTHTAKVLPEVATAAPELKHQLLVAIERVWDGFYSGPERQDVPLCLGSLAIALGQYQFALKFLLPSIELYGASAQNTHQCAVCYWTQGDLDAAEAYAQQALSIKPDQAPTQALLQEIGHRRAAQTGKQP